MYCGCACALPSLCGTGLSIFISSEPFFQISPTMTTSSNGHLTVNIAAGHHDNDDDNNAPPPSDNNNHNNSQHDNDDDDNDELIDPDDPFDITQTKNASHETLRRWRVIITFPFLSYFVNLWIIIVINFDALLNLHCINRFCLCFFVNCTFYLLRINQSMCIASYLQFLYWDASVNVRGNWIHMTVWWINDLFCSL